MIQPNEKFITGGIMENLNNYKDILNFIINSLVPICGATISVIGWLKSVKNSKKAKQESELAKKYAIEANEYYNSGKKYYEEAHPMMVVDFVKAIEEEILVFTKPKTLEDTGMIGTGTIYDHLFLYDKKYIDMAIKSLVRKNKFMIINMETDEHIRDFDSEKHLLLLRQ